MKHKFLLGLGVCLLFGCGKQATPVSLTWEMGKNGVAPGLYDNTFHIKNTGKTVLEGNWTIYFQQSVNPVNQDDAPLRVERIQATHCKMEPSEHYQPLAPGETLAFTFRARGGLIKESAAPQGAYIVFVDANGNEQQPLNIPLEVVPFTDPTQWTRPTAAELPYPDGSYVYEQNQLFAQPVAVSETDIFPSLKEAVKTEGTSTFTKNVKLEYDARFENEAALLKEKLVSLFGCTISETGETVIRLRFAIYASDVVNRSEHYDISIRNGHFELYSGEAPAMFSATQTLLQMLGNAGELPATFANQEISDYPDTDYRGLMLDVARNFTKKANVLKLLDLLAFYKMNVFHFHLTDDEAWRLEIPDLPELTEIGAHRGHTLDESTHLYPAFGWGWDAKDSLGLANGYYSRADFMEILQYAQKRHIRVIPEVDIPGHSRAAIKSMNARYHKYIATDKPKAEEYLLTDFADTSKYISAQNFTDNVLNVALPSTYRFVEKVIDEIGKMYAEAGVPLTVFHIGGDEVPRGAWEGSTICRDFMKAQGMTEIRELKDYFLEQVLPMLAKRNLQPAGWEEVAMLRDHTANPKFKDSEVLSYCWSTLPEWKGDEVPYLLANAGYPVILCNVTNFYMDMSYSKHPQEPGLHWGGFVNEYNSFDMLPYDIYKSVRRNLKGEPQDINTAAQGKTALNANARTQIKGVQGQLWAETIRNFEQIEYCLFPKMYGLIERAWNMQPAWSLTGNRQEYEAAKQLYNAKIAQKELPRLSKLGVNFRVAQPGIKLIKGQLFANTTIPGAEIRYTTDGSEPTAQSTLWTEPVACEAQLIKAKTFYLGKASVTTVEDIWQRDKAHRIAIDFHVSKEDAVTYIRKYYPNVTDEMLLRWEKAKTLEAMYINGEKKYFDRAPANLFRLDKDAMARKRAIDKPSDDSFKKFLSTHLPAVVASVQQTGVAQTAPVVMRVNYTVTLDANAVPDGEVVRCWLPCPREDERRQSDVKLLTVDAADYTLSPPEYAHRSLYMEKKAKKDEPLTFGYSFSYRHAAEWFNLAAQDIKPYDTTTKLYKTYTAECAPHVVFTDSIKALSARVVGDETDPYQKVKKLFAHIRSTYPWAGAREYSTIDNIPLYVMENGHGGNIYYNQWHWHIDVSYE
ncbi:hypothetical protein AGMMS4957_14910 [Bacteroidia bacterium]|nr:hypothetical protein AGMMS4957_14910 [Bacteroidia bacterium]